MNNLERVPLENIYVEKFDMSAMLFRIEIAAVLSIVASHPIKWPLILPTSVR